MVSPLLRVEPQFGCNRTTYVTLSLLPTDLFGTTANNVLAASATILVTISMVCAVFAPVWAEWRQGESDRES